MRVAFTGSHGTGKSTAAKHLGDRHGYTVIDNVSREAAKKGVRLGAKATFLDELALTSTLVQSHYCRDVDIVLARTLIDKLAYTQCNPNISEVERNELVRVFDRAALYESGTYDLLIYFPIAWPLEEDGVRPDEGMRVDVDRHIRDFLSHIHPTKLHVLRRFQTDHWQRSIEDALTYRALQLTKERAQF